MLQQKMRQSAGEDKTFENKLTYQLPQLFFIKVVYTNVGENVVSVRNTLCFKNANKNKSYNF